MAGFGTWQPKIRGKLFYNWPKESCEDSLRFTSTEQLGLEPYDVVIVGAGVIGCGLAYQLSLYQLRVLLVDRLHEIRQLLRTTDHTSLVLRVLQRQELIRVQLGFGY